LRLRLTALPAAGAADARLRHNEVERLRPGDDVREWERSGHRLPTGSPEGVSEANQTSAEESSRSPAERPPPNHQRASDGAARAGAPFLIPATAALGTHKHEA